MRCQPEQRRGVDCELVVATTEVLNGGVASDQHARRSIRLHPAHGPEPGLEPAVVAFDAVVLILAGVMPCGRKEILDHVCQSQCPVGDDLARVAVKSQGGGKERTRGGDVATP